jgi:indole-3-glycerol phosphate synthase
MTRLDQIVAATRERVALTRKQENTHLLEQMARNHVPRGFRRRLVAMSQAGPAVIAELKKASPSKGVIRENFPVGNLASQLAKNGASALSVLTDEQFFQGSLSNLVEASAATDIPCLRKDFMVDEFQMVEARAHRADAVLLILAALDDVLFRHLLVSARAMELDVICEVHDETELMRALEGGADIVGVNSRDLRTFEVNTGMLFDLAGKIPGRVLRIAESGLSRGQEIRDLYNAGYQAFLIGETLMRADEPGKKLQSLLEEAGFYSQAAGAASAWRGKIH